VKLSSVHIGNAGWSYLREKEFQDRLASSYKSKLQAYAQLFSCVELNSTFYRIPRLSTVQRWRTEADAVDKKFEFTVKASRVVTHLARFSDAAHDPMLRILDIASALRARIVLFQSPASFGPTKENIDRMNAFFQKHSTKEILFVWEPRGHWWDNPVTIREVCERLNLISCVDPLRHETVWAGPARVAYYRLHGFGKPSMYQYNFSADELRTVANIVKAHRGESYIIFNNSYCYENALQFSKLIDRRS